MNRKRATLDEIVATFSDHISKSYPSPADFRSNFDILLWGKRDRCDARDYAVYLEKNIVYLGILVEEALGLAGRLLDPAEPLDETGLPAALDSIEKTARASTGKRHERAFVERGDPALRDLAEGREEGSGYVEKLEFNYRYLMTLRLFIFEFISVLAAVRVECDVAPAEPGDIPRIRDQIGVIANYYIGNVSVSERGAPSPESPGGSSFS